MEVTIRAYDPRDAADLADVFFRSVRQVALSDYTAAKVRAWAPEPRTAEWAHGEASDGRLVLVAANVAGAGIRVGAWEAHWPGPGRGAGKPASTRS